MRIIGFVLWFVFMYVHNSGRTYYVYCTFKAVDRQPCGAIYCQPDLLLVDLLFIGLSVYVDARNQFCTSVCCDVRAQLRSHVFRVLQIISCKLLYFDLLLCTRTTSIAGITTRSASSESSFYWAQCMSRCV